jgi:hypothetical protein
LFDPREFAQRSSGVGLVFEVDKRDNAFTPTRGWIAALETTAFAPAFGSDTRYELYRGKAYGYWPLAGGRFVLGSRVDARAANGEVPFYMQPFLELPGVRAVYTSEDFAPLGIQMKSGYPVAQMKQTRVPPMAEGQVHYVGDPVAIVIAETRAIAEDAAGLVLVDYTEETPVITLADARTGPPVFAEHDSNVAALMALPEDPEISAQDGFGLTSMRERAVAIGAEWSIRSRRGAGTSVVVRMPKQISS